MITTHTFPAGRLPLRGRGPRQAGPARRRAEPTSSGGVDQPAAVLPGRQRHRRAVTVVLMRDGVPMRYFPIGAKGDVHVPLRVVEDLDGGTASSCTSSRPTGCRAPSSSTSGWSRSDDALERPPRRGRDPASGSASSSSATAWPAPAPSRRSSPAAGPSSSTSRCSATSRTATTTASCSPTCSPAQEPTTRSSSTRSTGTRRTASPCTPACGSRASTASRKVVYADDGTTTPYDKLVIATGSRAFVPADRGHVRAGRAARTAARRVRVPHPRRHPGDDRATPSTTSTRAVVIGGGLLGLEAARGLQTPRPRRRRRARRPRHLMNAQLDAEAADVLRRSVERLGIDGAHLGRAPPRSRDATRSRGVRLEDGREIPCDMVVVAAGIRPNVELAAASGLHRRARRSSSTTRCAPWTTTDVYAVGECAQHRGQVYGLVAPLWEQAIVLADQLTGTEPAGGVPRLADRHQAQGRRRRRRVDGRDRSRSATTTRTSSSPSRSAGVYKSVVIRDDRLVGATLLGDMQQGRVPACRPSTAGCRCPRSASSCSSTSAAPPAEVGVAELPDDAQVCNCNGVSKGDHRGARRSGGCKTRRRRHGRRPAPARAAARARPSSPRSSSGRPAARSRRTRPPTGTCPASRWTSRTLMRSHPRAAA